jgi:hypothetical protein
MLDTARLIAPATTDNQTRSPRVGIAADRINTKFEVGWRTTFLSWRPEGKPCAAAVLPNCSGFSLMTFSSLLPNLDEEIDQCRTISTAPLWK